MSFANKLYPNVPSLGVPLYQSTLVSENNSLTDGANTVTISSISPTMRAGRMRYKIYNGAGTSPAVVSVVVTVTDGTTTELVHYFYPNAARAISSTGWIDWTFTFISELSVNSVSIVVTLSGTSETGKLDFEVSPGSTGNS